MGTSSQWQMDACVTTITEMPLFSTVMTSNGYFFLQCVHMSGPLPPECGIVNWPMCQTLAFMASNRPVFVCVCMVVFFTVSFKRSAIPRRIFCQLPLPGT